MLKQLLAAVAALTLAAPIAAQAQEVPSYAAAQNDQQIQGRVTAFDGTYNLTVADNSGYSDNVQLHDGTIINPTGLTLAPGMIVNVLGYNAGPVFEANEIDTPYTFYDAVPYYSGHPWNYYGPSFGLTFFFGNTTWWHHPAGFGGYDRGVAFSGGVHVNEVNVHNTYNRPVAVRAYNPPQAVRSYNPPQEVHAFAAPPAGRNFERAPQPVERGNAGGSFARNNSGSHSGGSGRATSEHARR
jgi:hypothetical protein